MWFFFDRPLGFVSNQAGPLRLLAASPTSRRKTSHSRYRLARSLPLYVEFSLFRKESCRRPTYSPLPGTHSHLTCVLCLMRRQAQQAGKERAVKRARQAASLPPLAETKRWRDAEFDLFWCGSGVPRE